MVPTLPRSRCCAWLAVASLVTAGWLPGGQADPSYYVRKATWHETVRASREKLIEQQAKASQERAFQPFVSRVLRGRQEPQRVVVSVHGLRELWLVATYGPDDYRHDRAVWGEPVVVDAQGKKTPLARQRLAHAKVGWGKLLVNQRLGGGPLRIGSKTFAHGYWAHAPSVLRFRLDGQFERFEAWVGIGIGAPPQGSCQFKVLDRGDRVAHGDAIWSLAQRDFPSAEARTQMAWERQDGIWDQDWPPGDLAELARRYAKAAHRVASLAEEAKRLAPKAADEAGLQKVRELYHRSRRLADALARARTIQTEPLRLAIRDLTETFGDRYPNGPAYLRRLDALEKSLLDASGAATGPQSRGQAERLAQVASGLLALQREALLANPLLDFDRILLVRRKANNLGLPANWQGNSSLRRTGYDNQIATLEYKNPDARIIALYRPRNGAFVGDVDLHFDATKMLFSSIGTHGRWQVFEISVDGTSLRQVTAGDLPDVDSYDACYLPDGRILFGCTANFIGVPCVFGNSHVSMLYRMDPDGTHIRQLCFEQDHDWCPTVLPNGRVLYLRWEYTDTPHSQTRLLFHMNPDGTEQMEYYGSNSYWPNSMFYARPIPGHPTKVVCIETGHHGLRRMGRLVILDPARGRHEADGAVQRIPGHGKKVEAIIRDQLANGSWPLFLHPYPLSEKHFLVSCKPNRRGHWGLYLVDVFDNMLLLREEPGYALLEPVPLRPTARPPAIPDKVDLARKDATVYLADVYEGPGLSGIPRGTVKQLRIFTYHFSYHGMGGLLGVIGMDGPWDMKRIIGTVPVEADGSALFTVPANTPISIQPLDSEGKALQLMRSWMTAMPGEVLSCAGCHERQNTSVPNRRTMALGRGPSRIQPWYGPARAFSFAREVQPVLDRYCVECHNGEPRPDGKAIWDLRGTKRITDYRSVTPGTGARRGGRFSISYVAVHRYVRRPGIESDYHLLEPMEFHADTTQLVQMLAKGHHGVRLDEESWSRLVTWIDLNTPFHGTWTEAGWNPGRQRQRRRELRKRYALIDDDPEADAKLPPATLQAPKLPRVQEIANGKSQIANLPGWPFDAAEARRRQKAAGPVARREIDLGDGIKMTLVLIPAGEFVMGDPAGYADEQPPSRVRIDRPFWLGACEVSNEQYARFDPAHDSRVESKNTYQFGVHGFHLNKPQQPVVRISWHEAMAFCRWLGEKTAERVTLPTEAQWEWAARCGSAQAFSFGPLEADYSKHANVADKKLREIAGNPYTVYQPLRNATKYDDWIPRDDRFHDGGLVSLPIGSYQPNAWGLHDMHGNAFEWTRSAYRPYPYTPSTQHRTPNTPLRSARGGSWRDRPIRCRSAFRVAYRPYQRVYNVGFRVLCRAAKLPTR